MGEVHIKPYAQGTPRLSGSDLAPRVLRLRPLELPLRVKVLADAHAEVEADARVRRVVGRHVVAAERAVEGRDLAGPHLQRVVVCGVRRRLDPQCGARQLRIDRWVEVDLAHLVPVLGIVVRAAEGEGVWRLQADGWRPLVPERGGAALQITACTRLGAALRTVALRSASLRQQCLEMRQHHRDHQPVVGRKPVSRQQAAVRRGIARGIALRAARRLRLGKGAILVAEGAEQADGGGMQLVLACVKGERRLVRGRARVGVKVGVGVRVRVRLPGVEGERHLAPQQARQRRRHTRRLRRRPRRRRRRGEYTRGVLLLGPPSPALPPPSPTLDATAASAVVSTPTAAPAVEPAGADPNSSVLDNRRRMKSAAIASSGRFGGCVRRSNFSTVTAPPGSATLSARADWCASGKVTTGSAVP
eukprot:scaffold12204_cov61-Phaeocystis_antarctica.AAC.13